MPKAEGAPRLSAVSRNDYAGPVGQGTGTAPVIALIDQHLDEISDLCSRYQVARLDLFGSAATDDFDPVSSDLDFIVV